MTILAKHPITAAFLLIFYRYVTALDLPDERWLRQQVDDDSITSVLDVNFERGTSQQSMDVLANYLESIGCTRLERVIRYDPAHEEARKKFDLDLAYRSDCSAAQDPMAASHNAFSSTDSSASSSNKEHEGIQTAINLLRQKKESGDAAFSSFGLSHVAPEHKINAKVVEGSERLLVELEEDNENNNNNQGKNLRGRNLNLAVNDDLYEHQSHYAAINLEAAWNIVASNNAWPNAKDIIVQVIDSGIDFRNTDLKFNNWTNPGEICGNGIDDDNNGRIDDCHGYNFVRDDPGTDLLGRSEHGSHCAGTIGARTDNGIGLAGIAGGMGQHRGISLMASLGFGNSGAGSGFAEAITYGAENGVRVQSNSWGYSNPFVYDRVVLNAVNYATSLGVSVVFAAGNDSSDDIYYPGAFTNSIGVAATNNNGIKAGWSNWGQGVDISAPGVEVASTGFRRSGRNRYIYMSGTSMACPHVSGTLALGLVLKPEATRGELQSCLFDSAEPIDSLNSGRLMGAGMLNAEGFLNCLQAGTFEATDLPTTVAPTAEETTEVSTLWNNLNSEDFEGSDTGEWSLGRGPNARLHERDSQYAFSGVGVVRLRGRGGASSSLTSALFPLLSINDEPRDNQLRVTFSFMARSMEVGEYFKLRIKNKGTPWQDVRTFTRLLDFDNRRRYTNVETLINLPSGVEGFKLRFECVASGRKDFVYIDDISVDSRYNSLLD